MTGMDWMLTVFVVILAIGFSGMFMAGTMIFMTALDGTRQKQSIPWSTVAGLAAAAAFTGFSFGVYGLGGGTDGYHAQQIPLVQRVADASVYPEDPYAATAHHLPSHAAGFLGTLLRWEAENGRSPERLYFWLHLAFHLMLHAAFFGLAFALFHDMTGALVSLGLFVLSWPLHLATPLAHDVVVRTQFDLTAAAWPLAVFAFVLWTLHRNWMASLIAGLIAYVQPLLSAHLLLLTGMASLFEGLLDRKGEGVVVKSGAAVLPGAIVSLPVWAFSAKLASGGGSGLAEALAVWHPAHYFASTWSAAHWTYGLAFLGLCAYAVWRQHRYEEYRWRFPAVLGAFGVLWLLAGLGGALELRPLLLLQLYRTDAFLVILALACAGHEIHRLWTDGRATAWAAGGLLLAAFAAPPRPLAIVLVAAAIVLTEKAHERQFEPYAPALRAAAMAGAAALGAFAMGSLFAAGGAWGLPPDAALAAAACAALLLFAKWRPLSLPDTARAIGAALVCALVLQPSFRVAMRRWKQPKEAPEARALKALHLWAGQDTSKETRFVVPPSEGLRALLGRPVVFQWVDGAAMHWSPGFEAGWLARARGLGIDLEAVRAYWRERDADVAVYRDPGRPSPVTSAFKGRSEAQLAAYLQEHNADYLVAYADMPRFRKHFQEQGQFGPYRVYQYLYNYAGK